MITPDPMPRRSVRFPSEYTSCPTSSRTTAGKIRPVTSTTASGVADGKGEWVAVSALFDGSALAPAGNKAAAAIKANRRVSFRTLWLLGLWHAVAADEPPAHARGAGTRRLATS